MAWPQSHQRCAYFFALGLLLVLLSGYQTVLRAASPAPPADAIVLSPAQAHPLPPSLQDWQAPDVKADIQADIQTDYFDQIKPSRAGFLVWSQLPATVYVTSPSSEVLLSSENWQSAIAQAVADWSAYVPLRFVTDADKADIVISPNPPQRRSGDRVRSAETRYRFYVSDRQLLRHRVTIYIRPNQTVPYITAAARHELGHALGIWGHSTDAQDVMYFAQVGNPPAISPRDVSTLRRIYQQPTQLGWPVQVEARPVPSQKDAVRLAE